MDVLDAPTNENPASYAAIATPQATVEENMPPRSATYRDELYLSSFEHTNFHAENVTPDRPCTTYFNSGVFADSNAVFQALRTQGFPTETIRCSQRKPTGDMFRHRRFAINDEDRQLTYLNIYDAPHELSDNALIQRLEPYCEVITAGDDILLIDLFSMVTVTIEYADMLPSLPICILANFLYGSLMLVRNTYAGSATAWVIAVTTA